MTPTWSELKRQNERLTAEVERLRGRCMALAALLYGEPPAQEPADPPEHRESPAALPQAPDGSR
jgi:hypothetical protein